MLVPPDHQYASATDVASAIPTIYLYEVPLLLAAVLLYHLSIIQQTMLQLYCSVARADY